MLREQRLQLPDRPRGRAAASSAPIRSSWASRRSSSSRAASASSDAVGQVGQGRPAPHREGVLERGDRDLRVDGQRRSARPARARRTAPRRPRSGSTTRRSPAARRWSAPSPRASPEIRDVGLQGVAGLPGRLLAPDLVDQGVGRHHLVGAHQEVGEDGALLRPAERQRTVARVDLERAEHTELHPATVTRVGFTVQGRIVARRAQEPRKPSGRARIGGVASPHARARTSA